jgi:hypothetical protein
MQRMWRQQLATNAVTIPVGPHTDVGVTALVAEARGQHRAQRPLRCRPVVNRLGGHHVVVLFIHAVLGQSQRIETSEGDAQILCRPATIGTRLCVAVGTPGGWWVDRS